MFKVNYKNTRWKNTRWSVLKKLPLFSQNTMPDVFIGLTIVSVQNLAENLQSNNLIFTVILFQPLNTTVKINF